MKSKIYIFLFININVFQFSYSQELKKYISDSGHFEYQYYENSQLERIFNGTYKELSNNKRIKGQFKENKKSGYWQYVLLSIDKFGGESEDAVHEENFKYNTDTIYSREVSGNYENNKKNGIWTFKSNYDLKSKKYRRIRSFEFKNDTIIGNIDFSEDVGSLEPGYKGQIDSSGNFTGLWQKKINSEKEDVIEFYKGFIIKVLKRDLTTGDIYEKYIPNKASIINVIDKIILNKIKLTFENTSYNYSFISSPHSSQYFLELKNLPDYFVKSTNGMGDSLIDIYFTAMMEPWSDISQYKGKMNIMFYHNNPVYLIKLDHNDFHFEKFGEIK
jgi:hypothetical protein